MLMAGLDGIKNKIDPGQPLDKDIFELEAEESANIPSMPGSLENALDELVSRSAIPAQGRCLHRGDAEHDIDYKREKEVNAMRLRPHPYEFMMYYDIQTIAFATTAKVLNRRDDALRSAPDRELELWNQSDPVWAHYQRLGVCRPRQGAWHGTCRGRNVDQL